MSAKAFEVGACTDKGNVQPNNQDNFLVKTAAWSGLSIGLFAVADGVGGMFGGEIASQIAVSHLLNWWNDSLLPHIDQSYFDGDRITLEFQKLFLEINRAIFEYAQSKNEKMGTTLSVLFVVGEKYFIAHVGDTRIYSFRNRKPFQLTEDHTWVAQQVKKGLLTKEEIKHHPKKNLLTNGMGLAHAPKIFSARGIMGKFDHFVLCSDGLYHVVPEDEMNKILLKKSGTATQLSEKLISLAKQRGAYDNLTAVIVFSHRSIFKKLFHYYKA